MECLTSDIYDAALKVISEVQSHPLHINNCVISALVGDILTVIAIQSTYISHMSLVTRPIYHSNRPDMA